jgi:hypothetical protein
MAPVAVIQAITASSSAPTMPTTSLAVAAFGEGCCGMQSPLGHDDHSLRR